MKASFLEEEQILAALEPHRKKTQFYQYGMYIFAGLTIALCVLMEYDVAVILFILSIAGMVAFGILFYNANQEYQITYKQVIARPVLDSMFDDVKYFPLKGITLDEFKQFHLIRMKLEYKYDTEDLIQGTHKGIAFRQADVRVTHSRGKQTVVDVDGRVREFAYHKDILGSVLIVKKNHQAQLEQGLHKVQLEDVDFNSKFDVYAADEHSVFYLLTPRFMEYIKRLYQYDKDVYIRYDGDKLYFMQSGAGGVFEPPTGQINVKQEWYKARQELEQIGEIIDMLQLEMN